MVCVCVCTHAHMCVVCVYMCVRVCVFCQGKLKASELAQQESHRSQA